MTTTKQLYAMLSGVDAKRMIAQRVLLKNEAGNYFDPVDFIVYERQANGTYKPIANLYKNCVITDEDIEGFVPDPVPQGLVAKLLERPKPVRAPALVTA